MKAIRVAVYKAGGKDFSNSGISSKYDDILLVCEQGWIDIDETNPPENTCILKTEYWGDDEYRWVEPIAAPAAPGYMHGGCFVYTTDCRFPSDYPLPLHDRSETQAQYDMLSI